MSKKQRVAIPPLQINPVEHNSLKALMGRMRAPVVDSHQLDVVVDSTPPAPQPIHQADTVDSHRTTAPTIHQTVLADSHHASDVDSRTQTGAHIHPAPAVDSQRPKAPAIHHEIPDSNISTKTTPVDSKISTVKPVDSHQAKKVDSRRGDRHNTSRVGFFMRPDPEVLKQVRHYCTDAEITIQEFYDQAAIHLMQTVDSKRSAAADSNISHDDLKISKTNEDIINIYKHLTGNKWNPANDRAGVQFNDVDRRIIEVAMLQTVLNAKGRKINSFAYFVPEINTIRELGVDMDMIDGVLKRRREQWQQTKGK